jgi:hypothetical protein
VTVEHCPTCGATVRVVSGDEGTSHYEPFGVGAVERIEAALKIIEANRASDGNLQMGRAKASQVIELLRTAEGQS